MSKNKSKSKPQTHTAPAVQAKAQPSPSPQAPRTWLRMEGVNLSDFIFDTNDLSTVRGGSLLLLNAVEVVHEALIQVFKKPDENEETARANTKVKVVSQGASAGLFCMPEGQVTKAINAARFALGCGEFKHACFVVNAIEADAQTDFKQTVETLIALNRHQQMTQPALQAPVASNGDHICTIDRIRPASKTAYRAGQSIAVSEAVHARRAYGKEQKQQFYKHVLDMGKPLLSNAEQQQKVQCIRERINPLKNPSTEFADDFETLSTHPSKGILNQKMAVIYADGNRFGKHAQEAKTAHELTEWDHRIRALRSHLLACLLEDALEDAAVNEDPIRMETLLWGGDEVMFVVPAWKALAFVNRFLHTTSDWTFQKNPLTHSLGVVLCHHNAPIRAVKELAKHLAEQAKEETERTCNALHITVLESFDHIGNDWPGYLNRVYRGKVSSETRCLVYPNDKVKAKQFLSWDDLLEDLKILIQELPKGRMHDYMQFLFNEKTVSDSKPNSCLGSETPNETETANVRLQHDLTEHAKDHLKSVLLLKTDSSSEKGHIYARWSLISELWDYLHTDNSNQDCTNPNTPQNQANEGAAQ